MTKVDVKDGGGAEWISDEGAGASEARRKFDPPGLSKCPYETERFFSISPDPSPFGAFS